MFDQNNLSNIAETVKNIQHATLNEDLATDIIGKLLAKKKNYKSVDDVIQAIIAIADSLPAKDQSKIAKDDKLMNQIINGYEKAAKVTLKEGKKLDDVDQDELKGKFKDREDKDIDNDGDEDDQDEYLHKKRKAISKAVKEAVKVGQTVGFNKNSKYGDFKGKIVKLDGTNAHVEVTMAGGKRTVIIKQSELVEGTLTEKLDPKADAGVWIKDFQDSDDPRFDGKTKEERKDMALAAWYAARRKAGIKEDAVEECVGYKTAQFKSFHDMNTKKSGKRDDGSDIEDEDMEESYYDEAIDYIISEGIDIDGLSEEQLDEFIGSLAQGAKNLAQKAKQATSPGARADRAEKKASDLEQSNADRERLAKAKERIKTAKEGGIQQRKKAKAQKRLQKAQDNLKKAKENARKVK